MKNPSTGTKTRNYMALRALERKAGPMPIHHSGPRGGSQNEERDLLDEALTEMALDDMEDGCND